jgi:Leucine-rich repeat (LRR) protein|nr:hypothetical protein [Kofleriaceae bacterium]
MRGARVIAMAAGAACAACAPAVTMVPNPPSVQQAAAAEPARPPDWVVPVRVMMWTDGGEPAQLGELPGDMPAIPAGAAWFVEPEGSIDAAQLGALEDSLRYAHVPGLSLRGQPVAAWRDALVNLPDLVALDISDTTATAAPAAILPQLHRLYASRTGLDDAAVAAIAAAAPHLEVLALAGDNVTDPAPLAQLTGLRALDLSDTRVTDAAGAKLGALEHLEVLDLGRTHVAGATISAIRALPLRLLYLDHTATGASLGKLAPLAATLERFEASALIGAEPGDAELAWLAKAAAAREVSVDGAPIHDALVRELLALPQLTTLRIAGSKITRAGAAAIAARGGLEDVDLAKTAVDDASAAALLARGELRAARFDDTRLTDAALAGGLHRELTELYLARTRVTDAGLAVLDDAPDLVALGLAELPITDATLQHVAHHAALRTLVLDGTRGSQHGLGDMLRQLHKLERLYVENTACDDDALALLAAPHLHVLHVANTSISDASLSALQRLIELEELTLGDTRLQTVEVLTWPHLRTLALVGLGLHDDALAMLAASASLAELDLSYTEVHDPTALLSLPNLRTLGLVGTHLAAAGEAAAHQLAARGVDVVR